MDDILRILKFFILSTITFLIIEFIVMPNDFGTGIIMVLTVLVLSPINTVICEVIYFTNINRHILSKFWMAIVEPIIFSLFLSMLLPLKKHISMPHDLYLITCIICSFILVALVLYLFHTIFKNYKIKFKNYKINDGQ